VTIPVLKPDVPRLAVIVAVCMEVTVMAVIVKVELLWPADIVTDGGTWTLELLEESVTCTPPGGAGPERVSFPVREVPPTTEVALRVRLTSVSPVTDCTVNLNGAEVPPLGAGSITVIENVPAVVKSLAGSVTVSRVVVTKVVTRGAPLKFTLAPGTKFVPTTVSV
jgi:hypothetical protein